MKSNDSYVYKLMLPKEFEKKIKKLCIEKEITIKEFIFSLIKEAIENNEK